MTKISFSKKLPSPSQIIQKTQASAKKIICLADSKLKTHPDIKAWLKNPKVSFYFISSPEKSKSIDRLPFHLNQINKLAESYSKNELIFASLGGGAIGDLTGFIASVYKRGQVLAHIPTTYLAALDSAHGGKTALNVKGVKNTLGTFKPAEACFIVRDLLKSLPDKHKKNSYGELVKIAIISGGDIYRQLKKPLSFDKFWLKFLKKGIAEKLKIVKQDPFDSHKRKILNLGHTVGHVLESHYKWPHGVAVLEGLKFSANWSEHLGYLSKKHLLDIYAVIKGHGKKKSSKISKLKFHRLLSQDKKKSSRNKIDFVFIKKPGDVFVKSVSENEIIKEASRQGIVS